MTQLNYNQNQSEKSKKDAPGIYFCFYGYNHSIFNLVKKKHPNAVFITAYRQLKSQTQHLLAPTYEIERKIKIDPDCGYEKYKKFIKNSKTKMVYIRKLAEISVCKQIYLVGFYSDPQRDFRYPLKELIEDFYMNE